MCLITCDYCMKPYHIKGAHNEVYLYNTGAARELAALQLAIVKSTTCTYHENYSY